MNENKPAFQKQDDSDESLEVLKRDLYSRQDHFSGQERARGRFKAHDVQVAKNWGGEGVATQNRTFEDPARRVLFLRKFFIGSVIFFVVSGALALYVFFGGGNVISSNNVAISIVGPVSVSGGEVLPLEISISNQNNADLETADIIIDYPEGTRDSLDKNLPLKRYREAIGTVKEGETVSKKVQAVLFGEAGQTKALAISVEYRLKGSNAIFSKMKEYDVAISSAPVTLSVTSVSEVNANQTVEFSIDVISNASSVIQKLGLSAQYPFGFTFESSTPPPSWSNSFWHLGDVKPGGKRTIKVRGKIAGQDNEDRTFRFSVGTESASNENSIGTNFLTSTKKITIKKPFIGSSLALDGDTGSIHVGGPGKLIRADLILSNNAGVKITDLKVSVKLSGNILDAAAVSAGNGFYRSSERTILWDQTLKPDLAVLNPDDSTTVSFSLATLPESAIQLLKNPEMSLVVTVIGNRLNGAGLSEQINSTISRSVRVPTTLGLSTRALYYSGPFQNKGPIPPKVDVESSYTVVWSLTNGATDLSNVKVSATLPSYMKWSAVSVPQSEKISYNPIGGQILWEAGTVRAGTGFSGSPREVSFQVSLIPSSSQVGSSPILVTEAVASGDDAFAGLTIQASAKTPVTTTLSTDIGFSQGQGNVVQ